MDTLQDSIYPYLLKEYLISFILFLFVVVSALFLTLIVHKLAVEERDRKRRALTNKYNDLLSTFIRSGSIPDNGPRSGPERETFAESCISMLAHAPVKTAEKVQHLLRQFAVPEHFVKKASCRSWRRRHHAVETLGFFMMDDLKGLFMKISAADNRQEIRGRAVWAWSLIAAEGDIGAIGRLIASDTSGSSKFNAYIFTNIIASYRRRGLSDDIPGLLRSEKTEGSLPPIVVRDLIAACGEAGLSEAAAIITEYFYHYSDDPLIKIACLRALGAMGELAPRTALIGLEDRDWRVRAVAARASNAVDEPVLRKLRRLLYDFTYEVRINAARTLARSGSAGLDILTAELCSTDGFVRDIANSFLRLAEKERSCRMQ